MEANFLSSVSFKELFDGKLEAGGGVEAGAGGDGSGASENRRICNSWRKLGFGERFLCRRQCKTGWVKEWIRVNRCLLTMVAGEENSEKVWRRVAV